MQEYLRQKRLLIISKSNRRATVHRPALMDAIGIRRFDDAGEVVGERLFLGLFTSLAYSRSPRAIPLLRLKVQRTMARAGFSPTSHDGKALQHILDTFPRDELFQIGEDELFETALGILNLQERQRIALFVRRDPLERFVSCLVYVPRDRYGTDLRRRMAAILEKAFNGHIAGFQTLLDESRAGARPVHGRDDARRGAGGRDRQASSSASPKPGGSGRTACRKRSRPQAARRRRATLLRRYGNAFPTAYRESVAIDEAVVDIARIEAVLGGVPLGMKLYRRSNAGAGLGFKIFHAGSPVALSDILPMLENLGLKVLGRSLARGRCRRRPRGLDPGFRPRRAGRRRQRAGRRGGARPLRGSLRPDLGRRDGE